MKSIIKKLGKTSITVEKDYHSSNKEYNKLTIVEEQGAFKTYLSRKPVPVGIELTNREYWIPFSGVLESIVLDYLKFKQDYGSGKNLEDNAIITRHIRDRNVTGNKIADDAITTEKIVDDSIIISKLSTDIQFLISNLSKTSTFAGIATPTTNPGTPDGSVFYFANSAGIYTNFNNIKVLKGENIILKWNNNIWTKNVFKPNTDFDLIFDANGKSLTEFESGIVYDVSAHNYGAIFESLQALLNSSNLSTLIPMSVRHGGMSIRFIQSPANKYVQWRLVSKNWSTDVNNWVAENEDFRNRVMQEVNTAVASIKPIEITGDVTNAPDEEDLTSVNVGGTDVLKFKDKPYTPLTYSGMGRKILRKNVVDGVNTLTQSMMQDANTIYVIQYDFDLRGATIEVPENCVLEFNGGLIDNGILIGNNTSIEAAPVRIFGDKLYIYQYCIPNGVTTISGSSGNKYPIPLKYGSAANTLHIDKDTFKVNGQSIFDKIAGKILVLDGTERFRNTEESSILEDITENGKDYTIGRFLILGKAEKVTNNMQPTQSMIDDGCSGAYSYSATYLLSRSNTNRFGIETIEGVEYVLIPKIKSCIFYTETNGEINICNYDSKVDITNQDVYCAVLIRPEVNYERFPSSYNGSCCFEWFGAKSGNSPSDVNAVDSTFAIQKALLSPMAVVQREGSYKITDTVYAEVTKEISLSGVGTMNKDGKTKGVISIVGATNIYTISMNKPLLSIRCGGLYIHGGVFSTEFATNHRDYIVSIDCDFDILENNIDISLRGKKDVTVTGGVAVGEGLYSSGLHIDMLNRMRYISCSKIKVNAFEVKVPFTCSKEDRNHKWCYYNGSPTAAWTNTLDVEVRCYGYYQACIFDHGGNSSIRMMNQTDRVLPLANKELPNLVIGDGYVVDITQWDLGSETQSTPFISPYSTGVIGRNCILTGNSQSYLGFSVGNKSSSLNNPQVIVGKSNFNMLYPNGGAYRQNVPLIMDNSNVLLRVNNIADTLTLKCYSYNDINNVASVTSSLEGSEYVTPAEQDHYEGSTFVPGEYSREVYIHQAFIPEEADVRFWPKHSNFVAEYCIDLSSNNLLLGRLFAVTYKNEKGRFTKAQIIVTKTNNTLLCSELIELDAKEQVQYFEYNNVNGIYVKYLIIRLYEPVNYKTGIFDYTYNHNDIYSSIDLICNVHRASSGQLLSSGGGQLFSNIEIPINGNNIPFGFKRNLPHQTLYSYSQFFTKLSTVLWSATDFILSSKIGSLLNEGDEILYNRGYSNIEGNMKNGYFAKYFVCKGGGSDKRLYDFNGFLAKRNRGDSSHRPDNQGFTNAEIERGFCYYDFDESKPIYRFRTDSGDENSRWMTADGFSLAKKVGTTSERPTTATRGTINANTYDLIDETWHSDVGYMYFDTTLGKYICWNGTIWVNLDGTALN